MCSERLASVGGVVVALALVAVPLPVLAYGGGGAASSDAARRACLSSWWGAMLVVWCLLFVIAAVPGGSPCMRRTRAAALSPPLYALSLRCSGCRVPAHFSHGVGRSSTVPRAASCRQSRADAVA